MGIDIAVTIVGVLDAGTINFVPTIFCHGPTEGTQKHCFSTATAHTASHPPRHLKYCSDASANSTRILM